MACIRAKEIDRELSKQSVDAHLLFDPTGQAEHARAVFEIVGYGKATTDAISPFLNDRWQLGFKGSACDLKWRPFRDKVAIIDRTINAFLVNTQSWLDKDDRTTDGLPATRDEWIHRGVPDIAFAWPPTKIGTLLIPRSLDLKVGRSSPDNILNDFRSTSDFTAIHWTNLLNLVMLVLRTALVEERKISPELQITHADHPLNLFPILITEAREWKSGVRIGPITGRLGF